MRREQTEHKGPETLTVCWFGLEANARLTDQMYFWLLACIIYLESLAWSGILRFRLVSLVLNIRGV